MTTREKMMAVARRAVITAVGCQDVQNCAEEDGENCVCAKTAAAVIDAIGAVEMAEAFEMLHRQEGRAAQDDPPFAVGPCVATVRAVLAKATGGEHE